ncbi:YdcH family protein [Hydrogenophaga sp.]|uniref:YdcH family protein n=1 Tax=Hydrogenophaga sp. TaxID=1904254 RepID=UPI003F702159
MKGNLMFPEYRHLITSLKQTDPLFARLFDRHNELDQKVKNMEDRIERGTPTQIETLKKKKLLLKDELYVLLKKAGGH